MMNEISEQIPSKLEKDDVWFVLLDCERNYRFYYALSNRYRTWHVAIRTALLFSAVSGVVLLANEITKPLILPFNERWIILTIFAILTTVDFAWNSGEKAVISATAYIDYSRLKDECREIWIREMGDGLEQKIVDIKKRMNEIETRMIYYGIMGYEKINEESMKSANEVLEKEFKCAPSE